MKAHTRATAELLGTHTNVETCAQYTGDFDNCRFPGWGLPHSFAACCSSYCKPYRFGASSCVMITQGMPMSSCSTCFGSCSSHLIKHCKPCDVMRVSDCVQVLGQCFWVAADVHHLVKLTQQLLSVRVQTSPGQRKQSRGFQQVRQHLTNREFLQQVRAGKPAATGCQQFWLHEFFNYYTTTAVSSQISSGRVAYASAACHQIPSTGCTPPSSAPHLTPYRWDPSSPWWVHQ